MIFKLIRRNIKGKPFRFLLTCSAVTLGVMFTVGVFVFTDGLRATFGSIAEDIDGDTEYAVRSEVDFGDREVVSTPLDDDVVDLLNSIDGVVGVQPQILKFGSVPIDGDGEAQTANTAPNLGVNWPDQSSIPLLYIKEGRAPQGPGEFTLDIDAYEAGNFAVGETYTIVNPAGPGEFKLVGTFSYASPDENALVGAKLVAYDTATAREVINLGTGYDQITFETRGADPESIAASVAAALPAGIELVTGEQLVEEQTEEFEEFIGFFQTFMLVFAFIILAVSAFVIFNVFTILIGQRIRELGLLRAIGASGRQVTAALLGEALLVGIFATVVGTGLGIGFGVGLRWLLGQFDFGPSGNELLLEPSTFVWGIAVGIGVTMASAIAPSLRARRISPMAALREDARLSRHVPEAHLVIGGLVTMASWIVVVFAIISDQWLPVIVLGGAAAVGNAFGVRRLAPRLGRYATLGFGVVMMVVALLADLEIVTVLSLVGLAALTIFLGVNSISPILARPLSNYIGRWPLAILLGITGTLTAVVGIAATLGALYLVILSISDLVSDFDGAGAVGLLGSLALIPLASLVVIVGVRGVDTAFIMGWKLRWVAAGVVLFFVGAVGTVMVLNGLVGILATDWASAVILIPVGTVLLMIVAWLRRWLPRTLKSNARMARENAGRNPRRSASAAAALMIGLALVSTAAVVAASFTATFADVLEESVTSDWFISPSGGGGPDASFSPSLADDLEQLEEVDSVVRYRFAFEAYRTVFDGVVRDSSAADMATSVSHLDPDFVALDESLLDRNAIWVHQDMADDNNFDIGSRFDIEFPDRSLETVTVAGIFTDSSIYGNRVISLEMWAEQFPTSGDQIISVNVRDGVGEEQARAALEIYTDDYPTLNVETRDEFQDRQAGQINQALIVINVLVGVSVVIALLGIAITLALSVFERTRELGLVRAVGMTSRQMLRMVLFEGAIIAAFGGILGILLGTVFGSVAVTVVPDDFIRTLDIPVTNLLLYLVAAAIAGIAAAIVPARRAARLNVLDAIAQG